MKRFLLAVAAVVLFANPAGAATVPASEAAAHAGQTAIVEGVVSNVHTARSGAVTFLDVGGAYPNNAFTAVIFASDINKFTNLTSFSGKKVDISGTIKLFKDKPEIVLSTPDQLKLAP